jgi:hypothetical protein
MIGLGPRKHRVGPYVQDPGTRDLIEDHYRPHQQVRFCCQNIVNLWPKVTKKAPKTMPKS